MKLRLTLPAVIALGTFFTASVANATTSQFDLICKLHGRVVSDPNPTLVGTYPANVKEWRDTARFVVDLKNMRYCGIGTCQWQEPFVIESANSTWVFFSTDPTSMEKVNRKTGYYESKVTNDRKVTVTTGRCTREKFSGFSRKE